MLVIKVYELIKDLEKLNTQDFGFDYDLTVHIMDLKREVDEFLCKLCDKNV